MNPPHLSPTARALIVEAATREAHAWALAVVAVILAAFFFCLWRGELRRGSLLSPYTRRFLAAQASSKCLSRRHIA